MRRAIIGLLPAFWFVGHPGAAAQTPDESAAPILAPAIRVASSGTLSLIRRSDVQNGLRLSLRQRNELQALLAAPQQFRLLLNLGADSANGGPRQAEDQVEQQAGDHEARLRAILDEKQWARLAQIRLQWQGALALAEPATADLAGLSDNSRNAVVAIAAEYEDVRREVFASLTRKREEDSSNGTRRRIAIRIDTAELEQPGSPAYKKLAVAKKDAEERIIKSLLDTEKKAWAKACGAPFVFRADIKGLRF